MVEGKKILITVLAITGLAGCASPPPRKTSPPPADNKSLSELEMRIGNAAEVSVLTRFRLDDNPVTVNRLRQVGRRLIAVTERSKLEYRFFVLDTGYTNALSLANGHVFVTRGLMAILQDDDEVAAVVAHELSHLSHRHPILRLERRQKTLTQRILVEGLLGLIPAAGEKMAYLAIDQSYDQDQEFEADWESVRYMQLAGYDPHAAIRLLKRFADDPNWRRNEDIIASHPLTRSRIVALEQAVLALPASPPDSP